MDIREPAVPTLPESLRFFKWKLQKIRSYEVTNVMLGYGEVLDLGQD